MGEIMELRLDEVIKLTGLAYSTIYNFEKAGKFPGRFKIDNWHVRWHSRQIEEWVKNRGK